MIIYRCPFQDSLLCPMTSLYNDDFPIINLSNCPGPLALKDEDGDERGICALNIKDPVEAHIDVLNKISEKVYSRKVKDNGQA